MLGKAYSIGLVGIEGIVISCEADVSNGLPSYIFTGYLASQVKEAADRVKTAIKNSEINIMPKRVVVNLAPAFMKKSGNFYDLPIAISILCAYGLIDSEIIKKSLFIGELSLSGEVLKVNGIISVVKTAIELGFENIFVPSENEKEAKALGGIRVFGVDSLGFLYKLLNDELFILLSRKKFEDLDYIKIRKYYKINQKDILVDVDTNIETKQNYKVDFKDIKGQSLVKRASLVAVAGRHNIMLIGSPGSGKSMISKALPSIMPKMTVKESIETSSIYSLIGSLNTEGLMKERPFRSPHYNISKSALIGGGSNCIPGEISLSHNGVLFLDEFAEFSSSIIDVLRQPMEDRKISISRVNLKCSYPCDFVLCVATNPCKCGYYPNRERCICNISQVRKYLGKISKPILDRIDVCVETNMVSYKEIKDNKEEESSEVLREKVKRVQKIQEERFKDEDILYNSQMSNEQIKRFCKLKKEDESFLIGIYEKREMSVRSLNKILKVARTIADLSGYINIEREHLYEAISYRTLEDKYFGRE